MVHINITVRDDEGAAVWKQVNIKVLETSKGWFGLNIQPLLAIVMFIILIFIIISIYNLKGWLYKRKLKKAEEFNPPKPLCTYQIKKRTLSSVEMLELLNWYYAKNELEPKMYRKLKKKIMAAKGAPISVDILISKLSTANVKFPLSANEKLPP